MSLERYILALSDEAFGNFLQAPYLYMQKNSHDLHEAIQTPENQQDLPPKPPTHQDLLYHAIVNKSSVHRMSCLLRHKVSFLDIQNNGRTILDNLSENNHFDNLDDVIERAVIENQFDLVAGLLRIEKLRDKFVKISNLMDLAWSQSSIDMVKLLLTHDFKKVKKEVIYDVVKRRDNAMLKLLQEAGLVKAAINYILECHDYRCARELVHLLRSSDDITDETINSVISDTNFKEVLPFLEYARLIERADRLAKQQDNKAFLKATKRPADTHTDSQYGKIKKTKLSDPNEENTGFSDRMDDEQKKLDDLVSSISDILQSAKTGTLSEENQQLILDLIRQYPSLKPTEKLQQLIILIIDLNNTTLLSATLTKVGPCDPSSDWTKFLEKQFHTLLQKNTRADIQGILLTYLTGPQEHHKPLLHQEVDELSKLSTSLLPEFDSIIGIIKTRPFLEPNEVIRSIIKAAVQRHRLDVIKAILPKITTTLSYDIFNTWKEYITSLISQQTDKLETATDSFDEIFNVTEALTTYSSSLQYIPPAQYTPAPTPMPAQHGMNSIGGNLDPKFDIVVPDDFGTPTFASVTTHAQQAQVGYNTSQIVTNADKPEAKEAETIRSSNYWVADNMSTLGSDTKEETEQP